VEIDRFLSGVDIIETKGELPLEIYGISDNSREIGEGYCFVALEGEIHDGHNFINEAVKNGASLVVSEKEVNFKPNILVPDGRFALSILASNFYGHPDENMKVIGITGTNGKTTTAFLLRGIYKNSLLCSTIYYEFGNKKINVPNTTANPILLAKIMRDSSHMGVDTVIMEVSSHSLAQHRVDGIRFNYAVFTNLTREHLEYHKDIFHYRESKGRLFGLLKDGGYSIINQDDPNAPYFIERTNNHVITYGFNGGNIRGRIINSSLEGLKLLVKGMGRSIEIETPLIGSHNGFNILAAVTLAIVDNISDDTIVDGIKNVKIVEGRMERIRQGQPFDIFIDYAHSPDSVAKALSSVKEFVNGRIIVVFGAGGNRDIGKRELMGRAADELADRIIVTSDNPRKEDALEIAKMVASGIRSKKYDIIIDREKAIREAISIVKPGDVIMILGKGHEDYQIIGDRKIHFNDKEVVMKILKELKYENK